MKKIQFFLSCPLPRQSGWSDATVLPHRWQWRDKDFHVEIAIRRGRSCCAACGAAACFGVPRTLAQSKVLDLKIKKTTMLDLKFVLKKD